MGKLISPYIGKREKRVGFGRGMHQNWNGRALAIENLSQGGAIIASKKLDVQNLICEAQKFI